MVFRETARSAFISINRHGVTAWLKRIDKAVDCKLLYP